MSNKSQNPSLIVKNGILLFFKLLLVLFLGFFATRLSLKILGDEKFGIYNIVGGIIAIFAIISMPVRDSIQRFFNAEFANEKLLPNVLFYTSTRIITMMVIFITVLYESIGLILINRVIQYPAEETTAVNIIFQVSVIANFFSFSSLPYISLLLAKEEMQVFAICEIVGSILKIVFLYLIPFIPVNSLIPYSAIFLIINLFSFLFYYKFCKIRFPECYVDKKVDNTLRNKMLSFSGWSLIEAASGVVLTYGSNVFINIFGGILYNTAYGISKQLQNATISFSSNVLKAADPQITSSFTTGNVNYRDQLVASTAKISFVVTAFFFVLFNFEGEQLLGIWLDEVPKYAFNFCKISLLGIVFTSMSLPYRTLIMATGQVKGLFLCYGVLSAASMILMYILLKSGIPIILAIYILAAVEFVRLIITFIFSNITASISYVQIFLNSIQSICIVIISGVSYFFVRRITVNYKISIIIAFFCSVSVLLIFGYFFFLNKREKQMIVKLINYFTSRSKRLFF